MHSISFKPVLVESTNIADLCVLAHGTLMGPAAHEVVEVTHIAPLGLAAEGAFAFISDTKFRNDLEHCQADVIALTEADYAWLLDQNVDLGHRKYVVCPQPYALFAMVSQRLYLPNAPTQTTIHPSAMIASTAKIGKNVRVGAHVVVDESAQIGDNVELAAGVVIGAGVVVGDRTRIYPNVTVYADCVLGSDCVIHAGTVIGSDGFGFAPTPDGWQKIPQVGRVLVGDRVEIGANTAIDRGALMDTVIEDGVKIDNLVHIAHNCVIGAKTALAACVGMAGSTVIGKSCMVGGGALLGGHLTVADHTVISGATSIISDIKTAGQYTGIYPASSHRDWERNAPLVRQLSDLRKRIRGLERKTDIETESK